MIGCCAVYAEGGSLGMWLDTQRKAMKKNTLLPERQTRLQALVDQGKLAWGFKVRRCCVISACVLHGMFE